MWTFLVVIMVEIDISCVHNQWSVSLSSMYMVEVKRLILPWLPYTYINAEIFKH